MARRIIFIIFAVLLIFAAHSYSQRAYNYYYIHNSFFAEGATRGAIYSINYDRVFRFGEELNYSYRIGGSYYNSRLSGSVGISAFAGEGAHHPEISALVQPSAKVSYKEIKPSDIQSNFIGTFGYRYQKLDGPGLFIKAGFGMMFTVDPPFKSVRDALRPSYVGLVGLGYSF